MKKNYMKFITSITLVFSMVIGLAGCKPPAQNDNSIDTKTPVEIKASHLSEDGSVFIDSKFEMTASQKITDEQLATSLKIEPIIEYTLAGSGKKREIIPSSPLLENTVYSFKILDDLGKQVQSFAFQTTGDLAIADCYPSNDSRFVGLDSSIEIVFNRSDILNPQEHISIMPETPGRWEASGYSAIFLPEKPLLAGTVYQVKVADTLTAQNGMKLKEVYSLSFETEADSKSSYYSNLSLEGSYSEIFLPEDILVMSLYGKAEADNNTEYQISLHQYPDFNSYQSEIQKHDAFYKEYAGPKMDYKSDVSSLTQIYSEKSKLFSKGQYSGIFYAMFPAGLPEGYYIITLSGKNKDGVDQFVQKQVAIQNISIYTQSTNGQTLIWLNDPITGKAKPNVNIQIQDSVLDKKFSGTTDADGICKIDTTDIKEGYLSVLNKDTPLTYDKIALSKFDEVSISENYYTAVYTDREIYQPDDTIRFWGVVRPRKDYKTPTTITAAIGNYSENGNLYNKEVTVNSDGTFSGELKITGLQQDYYQLVIQTQYTENTWNYKNVYVSKSLSVSEYTKPPYVITATTDKEWYYADQTITMNIQATYFDGTPVSGGKLRLNGSNMKFSEADTAAYNETELTLDENGLAKQTIKYAKEEETNWTPSHLWYSIQSADEQDVYINTEGTILVLPSKVAAKIEFEKPSKVSVTTAMIDESKVTDPIAQPYSYQMDIASVFNAYAGKNADIPVTLVVNKREQIETETGTYYDPINKENIRQYSYEFLETEVDKIEGKTVDGKIIWDNLPYEDSRLISYWFELEFDGQVIGTVSEKSDTLLRYEIYDYPQRAVYSFNDKKKTLEAVGVGDEIAFGLYKNNEKISNEGNILYNVVQKNVLEQKITSESDMKFVYTEEYIPNIQLFGAYFDGKHIFKIERNNYTYDYSERTLKMDVSSDAKSYSPASEATINIKLSDKDGKPIAGSAVVGVVDEAVFSLMAQELDLPAQFYGQLIYANIESSASYVEYDTKSNPESFGGMGGGGGDSAPMREEFVDTALFQIVTVDSNGQTSVKLKLPDNITSWRITAAAVSEDNQIGNNTANTIATLPYYIRPLITDRYLDGDDLTISVNSVGNEVKSGDTTSYTAKLLSTDGKIVKEETVSGVVGKQAIIRFGKQPVGNYTIEITGKCGTYSDAIKESCTVVAQGLSAQFYKTMTLDELNSASSLRYPVKVSVYDSRLQPYMDGLESLNGKQGQRTEIISANYLAQVFYNNLLPENEQSTVRKSTLLNSIQAEDGGIRALPLANGDVSTTVKMMLAAPNLINKEMAVKYLKEAPSKYSITPAERTLTYAGLAAAKEPVLLDIKRTVAAGGLSPTDQFYFAAGLAKAGDIAGGLEIYNALSTIKQTEPQSELIYYKGNSEDETLSITAAALMAASYLDSPDAPLLMKWVTEKSNNMATGSGVLTNLEMLAYLESYPNSKVGMAIAEKPENFTCTINGKPETLDIPNTGIRNVNLSAEDFLSKGFKSSSENLMAVLEYTDYVKFDQTTERQLVKAEKTITPLGDGLKTSERAKVTIKLNFSEDAPSGSYEITDLIPSGMRYIEGRYNDIIGENIQFIAQHEGQRVFGTVYWTNPKDIEKPQPIDNTYENPSTASYEVLSAPASTPPSEQENIPTDEYSFTYYVSCSLPGEYKVESAYLSNSEANLYLSVPSEAITIN